MATDADIPIDIHYNKLLDWLINRRHCQQQWQGAALVIREKINNAIQDMPPSEEITQLLHGTYINYFHCLRIVELLKDTEKSTKNIFGQYSSQRMKDWVEVVKLYEKDGVYLAEAAQLLMRNVNYEIPTLKRQITKCQQTKSDSVRKEGEYASNAAELREKFATSCKQMGIEGKKIKSELMSLVHDLPTVYERIGVSAVNLKPAVNYYRSFLEYTLENSERAPECLPLIQYMVEHGNTTVYEWRTGKAPSRVEENVTDFAVEEEDTLGDANADEIDWGDNESSTIDYGVVMETEDGAIDWGDVDTGGGEIDWGETSGGGIEIEVVEDSHQPDAQEEGVAKGTDAHTLLDNTETRVRMINELLELEAFLSSRLQELNDPSDMLSGTILQSAPAALQLDAPAVQALATELSQILTQLTSPKMSELILIRSSPRYVDRLANNLKKTLESADKMMSLSRLMVTKQQESVEEQASVEPKIDLIRQKTKELQTQIEEEISKKYQSRRVNIMGEINTI